MGPTRLLMIRHAHVDTRGRLCGALDLPLSPLGRQQVRCLVEHCTGCNRPAALYTSPLSRARETAAALERVFHLVARVENSVSEIDCGRLEGVLIEEIKRKHPLLWARNVAQTDEDFTWPDGESNRQFRQRVLADLDSVAATHATQRVAIVTHAGVMTQVIGTIRGRPAGVWDEDRPDVLCATEVTWRNGRPDSVLMLNERNWC